MIISNQYYTLIGSLPALPRHFADVDKVNKGNVKARLKEIDGDPEATEEADALSRWLTLSTTETAKKRAIKKAELHLDAKALAKYPTLNEDDVRRLVVEAKWLAFLSSAVHGEMDRVSRALAQSAMILAERYETPLPQVRDKVDDFERRVGGHLKKMGFSWM